MIIHDVKQGEQAWHELRAKGYFTASTAPSMMGDGYDSRDKAMRYFLGIEQKEVSAHLQKLFDQGHESEEVARNSLSMSLLPLTATLDVDGLPLLASFDGITEEHDLVWEHKNTSKIFDEIPALYYWQLEHQLIVADALDAVLTVTDRQGDVRHYDYQSKSDRRDQLLEGWHQWQKDAENYERTDDEWLELANGYKNIKSHIDELTKEQKQFAKRLQELAGKRSAMGGGVRVSVSETWQKKQTPAAYIKAKGIELETTQLSEPEYGYRITIK